MVDLEYVDEGNEFGDYSISDPRIPKWRIPTTDLQRRVLAATKRKYWPDKHEGGKELRSFFITMERSMVPLITGRVSVYPTEYVDLCIRWFERSCARKPMPLKALVTFLNDKEKCARFVMHWKQDHSMDQDYGRDLYVDE